MKRWYFFESALDHMVHIKDFCALRKPPGFSAADDAGFDPRLSEPCERNAVLRVDPFDLNESVSGVKEVVQLPVRQDAVDIRQE